MRGEYGTDEWRGVITAELPPRARRIPIPTPEQSPLTGTTSACAENTQHSEFRWAFGGNYLRVRGEYPSSVYWISEIVELPPRARRIRKDTAVLHPGLGTTSACAENTVTEQQRNSELRNYLRVRGEYEGRLTVTVARLELPPRARRIRRAPITVFAIAGTTSACAENTAQSQQGRDRQGNYLRVRGEYT